ncbi:MAG: hypothetical protein K1X82_10760 [Bacteroidia bacterium]|nr:hypothetical protein [Bacteroidia bacterium]
MNKDDILRLIKNYLHSEVIDPGVQLNSNSKFTELGMDSFSIINLILTLESQTGISLVENGIRADDIETIDSLTNFVLSRT